MFGKVQETPQTEKTPFYPRSPYGTSKVAAHYIGRVYREAFQMNIYSGILFNHESPRRGEEFLSRTVAMGVSDIIKGRRKKINIGNLEAKRDWGYAKEYVEWIWKIMQHGTPDEFVIGTGETHSVREFIIEAFKAVSIDNWQDYIEYDASKSRPAEVELLMANAQKSKDVLGFEPSVKFKELVKIMVEAELAI
jgi:GDPmannose 4,6-dehydratase